MPSALSNLIAMFPGALLPFAGTAEPAAQGWLLCDGRLLVRADYPALFAAIGTTYNTGGETELQFRIPDLRGRVIAGRDNMGGSAANRLTNSGTGNPGVAGTTLGATGGADRHALTVGQMPQHNHNVNNSASTTVGGAYSTATLNAANGLQPVTANAGNNEAHPNVQPTIVLNYLIKT